MSRREALKQIGTVLRDRRKELGLSQVESADLVDVPRSTYSQYEIGLIDLPMSVFVGVCEGLKISPAEVLQRAFGGGAAADEALKRRVREVAMELLALTEDQVSGDR